MVVVVVVGRFDDRQLHGSSKQLRSYSALDLFTQTGSMLYRVYVH